MKTISKFRNFAVSVFAFTCLLSGQLIADDNEVLLDQEGDNLTLTILQAGTGNTVSGNSGASADLILTGSNIILDLIQDGDNNDFFYMVRPYCSKFLNELSEFWEIVIFTAAM